MSHEIVERWAYAYQQAQTGHRLSANRKLCTVIEELSKAEADNKALLDAAKGVVKLLSEPSPFYLKKLGGPITNGDQKQIDDIFIALDAALAEHSEPQ